MALGLQFVCFYGLLADRVPYLFLTVLAIRVINTWISRFVDTQSMLMLQLSVAACEMMVTSYPLLLIPFWLIVSPLPLALEFPSIRHILDVVPRLKPFDINRILGAHATLFRAGCGRQAYSVSI